MCFSGSPERRSAPILVQLGEKSEYGRKRWLHTAASGLRAFALLLLSEMFRLRVDWFWYLVQMSFQPLALLTFVFFLWGDPRAAQFAVTGSLVVTMSSSAMLSLGQYIGWMKSVNTYEHYAALPISRTVFLAAIGTRGVLLSLPSLLTVAVIGSLVMDVHFTAQSVVVLLLGAYAMSGLGAFIGFWSRDAQVSSLATQVLATIIIFLAPVYIPVERLPGPLQVTAKAIPTTYVARALRLTVSGAPISSLWPDMAVLAVLALVSLFLVPLRVPWRQN